MGVNNNNQWLQTAARKLYRKVGSFPLTYLDLPLGGNISRLTAWEPIALHRRQINFNQICYFKSAHLFHVIIHNAIRIIEKSLLFSDNFCGVVTWTSELLQAKSGFAQFPKNQGGLNISNLLKRNLGMLCKWIWRFSNEPNSLWRKVIQSKYKYDSTFCMINFTPLRHGGPLKSICNHILKNHDAKEIISTVEG